MKCEFFFFRGRFFFSFSLSGDALVLLSVFLSTSVSSFKTHSSQLSPPPTAFCALLLVTADARASLSKASTSAGVSSEGAMPLLKLKNFDFDF